MEAIIAMEKKSLKLLIRYSLRNTLGLDVLHYIRKSQITQYR